MAIVEAFEAGWLICHKTYLENLYGKYNNLSNAISQLAHKCGIFDIDSPFIMDSAVIKRSSLVDGGLPPITKKRKHSRQSDTDEHYSQVKDFIQEAVSLLVEEGKQLGYFCTDPLTCTEKLKNNSTAREIAKTFQVDNFLAKHCEENSPILYIRNAREIHDTEISSKGTIKIEAHDKSHPVILHLLGQKYIIPNNSQFLLADVKHLKILTRIPDNKFDVILLDPPWSNKSVKRKKGYWTLSNDELLHLPICELANTQCLIIVWTTNNLKQMSFVKSQLFPKWSAQHCAEWHWLKVTKRGIPIHPLESSHKKPYENLIIGERKTVGFSTSAIPSHRVIISVPSSIHSHKPPLTEILKPYVPENPKCLEIFGRYLLPGWTTCGNEVLKLQHSRLFGISEDKSST